jgi:hypothetical protein
VWEDANRRVAQVHLFASVGSVRWALWLDIDSTTVANGRHLKGLSLFVLSEVEEMLDEDFCENF